MNTLSNSSELQVVVNDSYVGNHSNENLTAELPFYGNQNVLLNFASACCVIFITIGIPGNLTTIIALARCKKVRNATAIFIINLHIGDFLYCCMVLPLTAVTFAKKIWDHGHVVRVVYALLYYTLRTSSIMTILAITINRYILVCHPLIYPRLYSKRNTSMMLIATWISSFVLFLPSIFGAWGKFDLDNDGICKMLNTKQTELPTKLYLYVAFFGPCLIIVLCYARIWWVVRKTAKKCQVQCNRPVHLPISYTQSNTSTNKRSFTLETTGDKNTSPSNEDKTFEKYFKAPFRLTRKEQRPKTPTRRDKKLFPMITAIMLSFCSTYLPMLLIETLDEEYKSPKVYVFANLLEYMGNCINPIIYVLMSNEYRQAYKSLYNCIIKRNAG